MEFYNNFVKYRKAHGNLTGWANFVIEENVVTENAIRKHKIVLTTLMQLTFLLIVSY